jgi:hypothetical protein
MLTGSLRKKAPQGRTNWCPCCTPEHSGTLRLRLTWSSTIAGSIRVRPAVMVAGWHWAGATQGKSMSRAEAITLR